METAESIAGGWDVTGQASSRATGGKGKTWVGWGKETEGSGL